MFAYSMSFQIYFSTYSKYFDLKLELNKILVNQFGDSLTFKCKGVIKLLFNYVNLILVLTFCNLMFIR
jgi:hypothetical protein